MLSKLSQHAVRSIELPAVGVAIASLDSMAARFASSDAASAAPNTTSASCVDVAGLRQRLMSGLAFPPSSSATLNSHSPFRERRRSQRFVERGISLCDSSGDVYAARQVLHATINKVQQKCHAEALRGP